jgi:hypothetical protein
VLPPHVPEDRIALMRRAFMDTMADAAFIADAKATAVEIKPMPGIELQNLVRKIVVTPASIVSVAEQWTTDN